MLAGRKLLLADDSLAIQKVIDLTFTDEGMQVTAVGDTAEALAAVDRISPDLVLADVFMPGGGGYELCERIKLSERFGRIPVMLLIGSFEPFDEAEARRVGADDVVTKPFQSIRQLVGRVGSLLGGKSGNNAAGHQYSTLGIGPTEPAAETNGEPNVHVFVEAPLMEGFAGEETREKSCEPDIELQTADTAKLHPAEAETVGAKFAANSHNNLEQQMIQPHISDSSSDSFLELEGAGGVAAAVSHDFVLDLEGDSGFAVSDYAAAPVAAPVMEPPLIESDVPTVTEGESSEPIATSIVEEKPEEPALAVAPVVEEKAVEPVATATSPELSPQAIDAIARRVVEQLSEKVVREIAWEVVPELAELLIEKKLEEQK